MDFIMINTKSIQQTKPIQELLEFCIINIDKPADCTSFDVAGKIKKIYFEAHSYACYLL